jgi:hypothetical protein
MVLQQVDWLSRLAFLSKSSVPERKMSGSDGLLRNLMKKGLSSFSICADVKIGVILPCNMGLEVFESWKLLPFDGIVERGSEESVVMKDVGAPLTNCESSPR